MRSFVYIGAIYGLCLLRRHFSFQVFLVSRLTPERLAGAIQSIKHLMACLEYDLNLKTGGRLNFCWYLSHLNLVVKFNRFLSEMFSSSKQTEPNFYLESTFKRFLETFLNFGIY